MSNKGDDNVPLMENKDPESQEEEEPVELRPLPIRAAHALLNTLFLLFGKEYGWAGFCYLTLATVCSVTTSIYTSWLGGCIVMMVFFASVFCFAGYQAVSGRYELARPLLLAGMAMFLTCILGGHFFREWSLHAGSELFDGISLADMPGKTKGYSKNAVFFWKDGAVDTTRQGEYKLCKDKLPVVGTCVYDYFCVAPIKAQGGRLYCRQGVGGYPVSRRVPRQDLSYFRGEVAVGRRRPRGAWDRAQQALELGNRQCSQHDGHGGRRGTSGTVDGRSDAAGEGGVEHGMERRVRDLRGLPRAPHGVQRHDGILCRGIPHVAQDS